MPEHNFFHASYFAAAVQLAGPVRGKPRGFARALRNWPNAIPALDRARSESIWRLGFYFAEECERDKHGHGAVRVLQNASVHFLVSAGC